jgi:hypothetical protein
MSKGIVETIIGGLELAAAAVLTIVTWGGATSLVIAIAGFLISSGSGLLFSGIGTMVSNANSGGVTAATRNPVSPWKIVYGRARVGGQIVFHGENSK